MAAFWFWAIAAMLTVYAVLDGFDIGAGIIHLFVARTDSERRSVLRSIGPVWDGNEVWLIAGGGVLFMAFPPLYASSFSGFYLPLTIVLWLLILRGLAVELRDEIVSPVWSPLWDVVFAGASAALAGFYGAAIGNVVRGVPLDNSGYFFLPLWTDFTIGPPAGILDWFTVTVGAAVLGVMAIHGAMWVAMKTDGELERRCRRLANRLWWVVALATAIVAAISPIVQPILLERIAGNPWGYIFPVVAIAGLLGMKYFNRIETARRAFGCSCCYVAGIAGSVSFGVYPYLLISDAAPRFGLTIYNSAAPSHSLIVGLGWFVPGLILAIVYMVMTYRSFAGKVSPEEAGY